MRTLSPLTLSLAVFLVGCSPDQERGVANPELGNRAPVPPATRQAFNGYEQINDALALAKETSRNVLLYFGNKGAYYFESLHAVFQKDKAVRETLEADYIVVLIDWTKVQNDKADAVYEVRRPYGAPWIVILDSGGKKLTTLDSSELEQGDGHSPKKVLAFLEQWKPVTK